MDQSPGAPGGSGLPMLPHGSSEGIDPAPQEEGADEDRLCRHCVLPFVSLIVAVGWTTLTLMASGRILPRIWYSLEKKPQDA